LPDTKEKYPLIQPEKPKDGVYIFARTKNVLKKLSRRNLEMELTGEQISGLFEDLKQYINANGRKE
jgi:deoxyadenosine/deoxycytidine kinase